MIQILPSISARTTRALTAIAILWTLCAPLLPMGAAAQNAMAQNSMAQGATGLIDGANIDGVLNTARQFGSAAISRQTNGDPLIAGTINNYRYTLRFLNCAERPACEDLNFHVGFQSKPGADVINAWNAGKRFSRAYLDAEGDAILEMDVALKGGVSPTNLSTSFNTWRLSLIQFIQHIGFK